ncbi:hypothetical protein [Cupriavidus sp. DL-D2]|uniref:hypothetical protein n=1 Tax=Cupriavidus sp. DL-D2 TaxID=3144974 RepID=UPI003215323B
MTIRIATFPDFCVPASDLVCSGRDKLEVPTGSAYDNELFAGAIGKGKEVIRYSSSLRGTRDLLAKTGVAAVLDLMLKTCPYVVEIRCHYPYVVRNRGDPIIIDRMVTVERRDAPGEAHMHAIMLTPSGIKAAYKRLQQEGVSCELLDPDQFAPIAIANASRIYRWARHRNIWDHETRLDAARFARALYESERRRAQRQISLSPTYRAPTLYRLMKRLGKRFSCSTDEAFSRLGVGMILGYVCIAPDHSLSSRTPLCVAPPLVRIRS